MGLTELADKINSPRHNSIPSVMQFPQVNIDGLKRKLGLKKMASEQGAADLPASDSEALDPIELKIIAELEETGREQVDLYNEQQNTYAERAADTNVQGRVLQIKGIVSNSISSLKRQTHTGSGDLYAMKRDLIQTEVALANFSAEHGLQRPAHNHQGQTFRYWILALMLAIEGVLNGTFLAQGSELGLIGGFLQAVIIAAINVAFGFIYGRFAAPQLSHRKIACKLIGWLFLPLYIGVAVGFNLVVAHYRTLMSVDPLDASIKAFYELRASPFGIDDLNSWALFLVGVLFSALASYEAWRLDDPYPGYGQVTRRNLESHVEYNDLKNELQAELDGVKDKADKEIEDLVRSITSRQGELGNIAMRSQTLKAAMIDYLAHLDTAAHTLLAYYHNENLKSRSSPAPERFGRANLWVYPRPSLDGAIISEEQRERMEVALKNAADEIPKQQELLNLEFRAALDEYKKVDDLVPPPGAGL